MFFSNSLQWRTLLRSSCKTAESLPPADPILCCRPAQALCSQACMECGVSLLCPVFAKSHGASRCSRSPCDILVFASSYTFKHEMLHVDLQSKKRSQHTHTHNTQTQSVAWNHDDVLWRTATSSIWRQCSFKAQHSRDLTVSVWQFLWNKLERRVPFLNFGESLQ